MNGDESFWYLARKDEEGPDMKTFSEYKITETKEVGEFKAYRLEKTTENMEEVEKAEAGEA